MSYYGDNRNCGNVPSDAYQQQNTEPPNDQLYGNCIPPLPYQPNYAIYPNMVPQRFPCVTNGAPVYGNPYSLTQTYRGHIYPPDNLYSIPSEQAYQPPSAVSATESFTSNNGANHFAQASEINTNIPCIETGGAGNFSSSDHLSLNQKELYPKGRDTAVELLKTPQVLPPYPVDPPKPNLHSEEFNESNCSTDVFRCTIAGVPFSSDILNKCRLPFGIVLHPLKDLPNLQLVQPSVITRCRSCKAYINPFIRFIERRRWVCNLCLRTNDMPQELLVEPETGVQTDPSERPEVRLSSVEYVAPTEYMLRPPQPSVYFFILDVTSDALNTGYLRMFCEILLKELDQIPRDKRTKIGFMTVDSQIHYYSLTGDRPIQLRVSDMEEPFIVREDLIVNLEEHEEQVKELLMLLPVDFEQNTNQSYETSSALTMALKSAELILRPTGGRLTVFQTCLPNIGAGSLENREKVEKPMAHNTKYLNAVTDFYKNFALNCVNCHIGVDLFLMNVNYTDLATLCCMSKHSGGSVFHFPGFNVNYQNILPVQKFKECLRHYLTRNIGFEAVLRIRCSIGLSINTFHGHFFVRTTDLLALPNIHSDAGFGAQISIDQDLDSMLYAYFQAALLYTTYNGERRIRVHTICLPVLKKTCELIEAADQECIIAFVAKMAVDRCLMSSVNDAREALMSVAVDILQSYSNIQNSSRNIQALFIPRNLKLLPLYILALIKHIAFCDTERLKSDDRVSALCQMKTLPTSSLIKYIYHDLYAIHDLESYIKDISQSDRELQMDDSTHVYADICAIPPRLQLTAANLDSRGAYLMDCVDIIMIYIGKNISPTFCQNVLGVPNIHALSEFSEFTELSTLESKLFNTFLRALQQQKPHPVPLLLVREDSVVRLTFVERLIDDRCISGMAYTEFVQYLKKQLKCE